MRPAEQERIPATFTIDKKVMAEMRYLTTKQYVNMSRLVDLLFRQWIEENKYNAV